MADAPNTVTTLSGNFKEIYADTLENLLPRGIKLTRDVKFVSRDQMPGNSYHQPVLLQHEHGVTYKAAAGGAFSLVDAVAGATKDATLVGTQMLLKSQIDYETAARASSGGKRAFRRALDVVVENMYQSCRKRMEIDYFWGQKGIADCSGATIVNSGNNSTVTFTKAQWAPGIWAGMETAVIDVFTSALADRHHAAPSIASVTSVDMDARQVVIACGETAAIADGDLIFFDEQYDLTGTAHNVFAGLYEILDSATTSLYGITKASYSLWQPTNFAVNGALTFSKVNEAIALATGKGLDEDLCLYISPEVWGDLIDTEVNRVHYDKQPGSSRADVGASGIQFYSQNGTITIKPSIYCRNGFGFMLSPRLYKRIGATDLTFKLPDRGDEFFRHLDDVAGYELRAYVNHALFTKAPGKSVLLTNIAT